MPTICDKLAYIVSPTIKHEKDRKKARNRVHVEGFNKADGTPIRFKSAERAERHLRNMLRLN
jgi:hypothetical protein